jgi:hypothetical protein
MKKPTAPESASARIDERINELDDWRGKMLARVRKLIHDDAPEIVEEWKWMGTPVWSHGGIVCTGETYKKVVKMTFGRALPCRTRRISSTPASTGMCGAPSTSTKATSSTRRP